MYFSHMCFLVISFLTLSSCATTPNDFPGYPTENVFNDSLQSNYLHENVSENKGITALYTQTRQLEEKPFFQKTLTIIEIDGEKVLPEPFPANADVWPLIKQNELATACADHDSGILCKSVKYKHRVYDQLWQSNLASQQVSHHIRGQQSAYFNTGTRHVKLLLFGYSKMGYGDIGTFIIDSVTFKDEKYYAHFEVEGDTVGDRDVHIWIVEGKGGGVVWEVKKKM